LDEIHQMIDNAPFLPLTPPLTLQDGAGLMREPQLPLRRGSESDMLSTAESSSLPRASEENPQQKPDPQKSWPYGNASLGPGGFQAVSEVARAKSFTGMGFNKKHMLELQVWRAAWLGVTVQECMFGVPPWNVYAATV
jgi:hypothetical protein